MAPYNILIVDDEVSNLNALRRTFRGEYNVFPATNEENALTIMERNDIGLIIASHNIPGMNGIGFLQKAAERYPDTIRIILAAYDRDLLKDAMIMQHIHSYITKPWEPEEIRAIVKAQLDGASRGRKMLGEILVEYDIISESQLEKALELQRNENYGGKKLGEILVDLGYTDEESIVSCYALQLGMPYISLSQFSSNPQAVRLLPSELALKYSVIPIDTVGRVLVVATSEPLSGKAERELESKTQYKIMTACALPRDIEAALEQCYSDDESLEVT